MEYTMTMISNIISKSDISSKQLKQAIRIVKMKREIIAIEKEIESLNRQLEELENAERYKITAKSLVNFSDNVIPRGNNHATEYVDFVESFTSLTMSDFHKININEAA